MDLRGKIYSRTFSDMGEPLITFKFERTADLNDIYDYDLDQRLKVKIGKVGDSRTNRQNSLMWAILGEIDIGINGKAYASEHGRTDIYTMGVEALGAEYVDELVSLEAIPALKNQYRACRQLNYHGEIEGKEMYWVRCFIGSSQFNKEQMGRLIDWFLRYAANLQIPITDYRNEWIDLFEEKKKKNRSPNYRSSK